MATPKIPDDFIIKDSITIEVWEYPFDFIVEATAYAEVLSIQVPFLSLPKGAQKMMLEGILEGASQAGKRLFPHDSIVSIGTDRILENLIELLNAHILILPYRLLFVTHGLQAYQPLGQFAEQIKARRLQVEGQNYTFQYQLVSKASYDYFYEWTASELYQRDIKAIQDVLFLTNNLNPAIRHMFRTDISNPIAQFIIPEIITLFPDSLRTFAYEELSRIPSEKNKKFLLKALQKERNYYQLIAVLKGLSACKDELIKEQLLDYYAQLKANLIAWEAREQRYGGGWSTLSQDSISLWSILFDCLKQYKSPEVEAIAWKELLSVHFGNKAIELLKENEVPEATIIDHLNAALEKDLAFFTPILLLDQMAPINTLPTEVELWDMLTKNVQRSGLYLADSRFPKVIELLYPRFTTYSQHRLKKMLKSPSDELKQLGLEVINNLGRSNQYSYIDPYLDQEIVELVKNLLPYHNYKVKSKVVNATGLFVIRLRDMSCLPALVREAAASPRKPVRWDMFKGIFNLLSTVPFEDNLLPILLPLLGNQTLDQRSWEWVVRILKLSPSPDVQAKIEAAKAQRGN